LAGAVTTTSLPRLNARINSIAGEIAKVESEFGLSSVSPQVESADLPAASSLVDMQDPVFERSEAQVRRLSLSPSAVLSIVGVTAHNLAAWRGRGQLPRYDFPADSPGHGNKRHYNIRQLVVLMVARLLIEQGLPVDKAMAMASLKRAQRADRVGPSGKTTFPAGQSLSETVFEFVVTMLRFNPADTTAVAKKLPSSLHVIFKSRGWPDNWVGVPMADTEFVNMLTTKDSMASSMREQHVACAIVVDSVLIAARIVDGIRRRECAK